MVDIPLVALQGQPTPTVNGAANAIAGAQAHANVDATQLANASASIGLMGSVALGAMGGDLNGQADPAKWAQGQALLKAHGLDMSQYGPESAPVLARAAITAGQGLQASQNAQQFQITLATLQNTMAQQAKQNQIAEDQLKLAQTNADPAHAAQMADATKTADAVATAKINLPSTIASGEQMVGALKQLIPGTDAKGQPVDNPGFNQEFSTAGIGPVQVPYGQMTGAIPNTPKADFQAKLDQVKSGAFLQGYKDLRGGGAISDAEGAKVEAAIAQLSTNQTKEKFVEQVNTVIDIVQRGVERARLIAAGKLAPFSPSGVDVPAQGGASSSGGESNVVDYTHYFAAPTTPASPTPAAAPVAAPQGSVPLQPSMYRRR